MDSSNRRTLPATSVSGGLLNDLADASDQVELISRADQLEAIGTSTLERFSDVWILDESAEPEPGELEEDSPNANSEAAELDSAPLVGLHAKLYVVDEGWDASIFTGSANATHAAFHQNVEFLTQIRGKKSKIGVAAILGESRDNAEGKTAGAACLMDMLQPFKPAESAEEEDEAEKKFERDVDELARQIASVQPSAVCITNEDGNGFQIDLKPNQQQKRKRRIDLGSETFVSVRPASQPTAAPIKVDLGEDTWATFPSLAMLSLTSFFVFSVSTEQPKKMTREFVLNLPLAGEPEGRKEALLRHLLSDKDRVLRFMMLLLSDADASAFAEFAAGNEGNGESFQLASMLDGRTLFESMMQCAWKDPSRLQQIANMIADLQGTDEGQELIPDDLDAIWNPIWAVAEQKIEKSSKRRNR